MSIDSTTSTSVSHPRRFTAATFPRANLPGRSRLNEAGGGALVAVHQETVVGVVYYVTVDGKTAEPAILVEDSYQHRGIGRRLATALVQLAHSRGIETFNALILPRIGRCSN